MKKILINGLFLQHGHLSAGESSEEGALRELFEELDIKVPKERLKYLFTFKECKVHREDFINNEFSDVYLVEKDIDLNCLKFQKEEVAELKFISYKEIKNRILDDDDSIVKHPEMYRKLFAFLESIHSTL